MPLSQLSRSVQTVHILRCDCFFLHCIWCLALWGSILIITFHHGIYSFCSERIKQAFPKSSLHKHTCIHISMDPSIKKNSPSNYLSAYVPLKSFVWLLRYQWAGSNLLYLNAYSAMLTFFPCWSIATFSRTCCSWETVTSSNCMAHLLIRTAATGATLSETKICPQGAELRPQIHFIHGKQTVSDSKQAMYVG